jgi:hypothetical protein
VNPANPVVQLKTTSQGLHNISRSTTVGCGDWLEISGNSAIANVTFSPKVWCQLSQIGPGQPASAMQIRNPKPALFTLEPGEVVCIFGNRPSIPMCGEGTVSPSGGSSGLMECSDPLFIVAVLSGTMRVNIHSEACLIPASKQLTYNFATGKPAFAAVTSLTKAQIELLYRQADELGMALAPRPSSLAPSCKPA